MDGHLRRIERQAGVPGLAEALARLAPTDLQSLLLHVFREQAARRDPRALLAQYERDKSVAPARPTHALEALALRLAAGSSRSRSPRSARSGSTACSGRSTRTTSPRRSAGPRCSPTRRPRSRSRRRSAGARTRSETVRLCAVCRVLRLQPFPDEPGFSQHFALFALVTAGRSQPSHGFEIEALREHVAVYRRLLDGDRARGAAHRRRAARARSDPGAIEDPDRTRARGYYDGALLDIAATDREGQELGLADGGLTDWTQRLLSNRKERLFDERHRPRPARPSGSHRCAATRQRRGS